MFHLATEHDAKWAFVAAAVLKTDTKEEKTNLNGFTPPPPPPTHTHTQEKAGKRFHVIA